MASWPISAGRRRTRTRPSGPSGPRWRLRLPSVASPRPPPCCTDRPGGAEGPGGVGERPLPPPPDLCRAVQGQRRSPPPHPEAAAPGHELGRVRRRPPPAREPDGVVHGRGGRGVARPAPPDPGRPAVVLTPGQPEPPGAAGRLSPPPTPDRRADRP